MTIFASRTSLRASDMALRGAIVGLAMATGYVHSTLGGPLFTLNALGYATLALAMVIPLPIAVRFRWAIRLGLVAYAFMTIAGWAIQGPYYSTAYVAKAIEVALIVAVAIDFARMDGSPVAVVRRELSGFGSWFASVTAGPPIDPGLRTSDRVGPP